MGSLCPALKIQAFERREKERERERREEREREETALCDAEKSVLVQYDAKVKKSSIFQGREKKKKKKQKSVKREKFYD
jgi:hypothetical protein